MSEYTPHWEGTVRGYRTNGRDPWQVSIEMPKGPGIFNGTGPSINFERGQKVHVLTPEGLAEVERAAAEKALSEAAESYQSNQLTGIFMGRDDYPRAWLRNRAELYRREEA